MRTSTESQLRALSDWSGLTLGSHTWSHPNLAVLDSDTLKSELESSRRYVIEKLGSSGDLLAYPYGLSNSTVVTEAQNAGYRNCFAVTGGWFKPGSVPAGVVPRLNVPSGIPIDR